MKHPIIDDTILDPLGNLRFLMHLRSTPEWQEREWKIRAIRQREGDEWDGSMPEFAIEAQQSVPSQHTPAPAHTTVPATRKRGRPASGVRVNAVRFKSLRKEYSQEDFAGKCDVSTASIQRGEAGGRLSEEILRKVVAGATILRRRVTVEDLSLRGPE
jgi:hypothetical protein